MILYHAISAFQIFEVILHRHKYHKREKCILILPDFIISKYPNYNELKNLELFDEVYLFSYMKIPHNEKTVLEDTYNIYNQTLPYKLESFDKLYIAGAHFYFSLMLINKGIPFSVFEDATGMLSQGYRLYFNLHNLFPVHAEIMEKAEMFHLTNKYIQEIICTKKANDLFPPQKTITDFDVIKVFKRTPRKIKERIYQFYNISNFSLNLKDKVLLITQNFSVQGIMTVKQQFQVYALLKEHINKNIVIKVHPDDELAYEEIFPSAEIIKCKAPLEVLMTKFKGKPSLILSFSSSCEYYIKHLAKTINFKETFSDSYDISNEYESILKILKETQSYE